MGDRRVLLTGATGYIGGRLLHLLEGRERVRCMARRPEYLEERAAPGTEVVRGDVLDASTLGEALAGVDVAYYLVHSMGDSGDFHESECRGARNFADAAAAAGVRRIVYLGGLGHGERLSPHLASRQDVGKILASSGLTTIELRSGVVIGSGSLSFEMIRSLVERLPVMIIPRWVRVPTQPIAVEDILEYLVAALDVDLEGTHVLEIGGPDVVSYADLMSEYARQRGLRRLMLRVPVLTPGLSSKWLGLVTPLYARVGRKLIESIRNETVVRDHRALEVFAVRPRGVTEAIARALRNEDHEMAETRWSDALSSRGALLPSWGGVRFRSRLVDHREVEVEAPPNRAFRPIRRIGGETGWYFANALWRLRGFIDLLVGGVGVRRGRPHPDRLLRGDTVDWWRVEEHEPDRLLRLAAEMKVPGRAWLQFEVEEIATDRSRVSQTAIFDPAGLGGIAYWYGIYPVHAAVFRGMLSGIARAAEAEAPD
jgi:uncharacterized protein YbjT (DUF2867 family)